MQNFKILFLAMTLNQNHLNKHFVFQNWSHIYTFKPQLYFQPHTVDELVTIVQKASSESKKLTCIGSGHTPNNLALGNDWLVNLKNLNQIKNLQVERNYADVTFESGIPIKDLDQYLTTQGYSLQNLPSIEMPTVAGLISTGSHGSSAFHGLISQQIVGLKLINGVGKLISLDQFESSDLFKAAILSLGQLGIIVEITLRVIPKYNVHLRQEIISFEKLLEMWEYIWISEEFCKVWWYPYSQKCIITRGQKTEDDTENIPKRKSFFSNIFYRFTYQSLLYLVTKFLPSWTPKLEKFIFNLQYSDEPKEYITTPLDSFTLDCLFSQFVDEWSLPMNNGKDALKLLNDHINNNARLKQFYVHAPIEIRCGNCTTPRDISLINNSERNNTTKGPIYGNNVTPYLDFTPKLVKYVPTAEVTNDQLTLFINTTIYRPFGLNSPVFQWFTCFEEIMLSNNGRPHWAKNFVGSEEYSSIENKKTKDSEFENFECRGLGNKINDWYGDDLKQFLQIQEKLDPNHIFQSKGNWFKCNGFYPE